jgi:hypothetical protein
MAAVAMPAITIYRIYRRAAGSPVQKPRMRVEILLRKYRSSAAIVPAIIKISNSAGTLTPIRDWAITRWPELEIGSHSVNPCISPSMSAWPMVSSCIQVIHLVKKLYIHSVFNAIKEGNARKIRKDLLIGDFYSTPGEEF